MAKSRPSLIGRARATGAGQPPAPVVAPAAAQPQPAAEALPPGAVNVDMSALLGALQDETTAVVNLLTQRSATNSAAARRLVEQLQAAQNDAAAARAETAKLQQELTEMSARALSERQHDQYTGEIDRLSRELVGVRQELNTTLEKLGETAAQLNAARDEIARRPIAARVIRIKPNPDSGVTLTDQPEPAEGDDTPALAGDD